MTVPANHTAMFYYHLVKGIEKYHWVAVPSDTHLVTHEDLKMFRSKADTQKFIQEGRGNWDVLLIISLLSAFSSAYVPEETYHLAKDVFIDIERTKVQALRAANIQEQAEQVTSQLNKYGLWLTRDQELQFRREFDKGEFVYTKRDFFDDEALECTLTFRAIAGQPYQLDSFKASLYIPIRIPGITINFYILSRINERMFGIRWNDDKVDPQKQSVLADLEKVRAYSFEGEYWSALLKYKHWNGTKFENQIPAQFDFKAMHEKHITEGLLELELRMPEIYNLYKGRAVGVTDKEQNINWHIADIGTIRQVAVTSLQSYREAIDSLGVREIDLLLQQLLSGKAVDAFRQDGQDVNKVTLYNMVSKDRPCLVFRQYTGTRSVDTILDISAKVIQQEEPTNTPDEIKLRKGR